MAASRFRSVSEAISHVFPQRRIYIRSDSRTRYLTLGPAAQSGLACVLVACIGWAGFTSWAFIDRATDGQSAESRLETTENAYEVQLAALRDQQRLLEEELNRANARGDAVTRQLSEKQRLLVDAATRAQSAEAELAGLRAEVAALASGRRDALARADALTSEAGALQLALAEAARREAAREETLASFTRTVSDVIAARDDAVARAGALDLEVAALEEEIGAWEARQETLLARIEQATSSSLEALDEVFVNADIDVEDILRETRRDETGREETGRGGPFAPIVDGGRAAAEPANLDGGERVAALMGDLERIGTMRVAIDRLPFGIPTRGAELTSSFGPRRDPFRRGSAMHEGIDFAAPTGTPIYATAEGVVVFSGRQSGYGNIVKIRHAFGFETVYAHLSKRRVRIGQRVRRGAFIADMGSTGRSTGSHLHYEVRIDGQAINPSKFIGAARHVL
jgi:murein DD-endopeptidase MepM/ murein hydrolase activator NlpD